MNNIKTSSKKLKWALAVALLLLLNIAIGVLTATGIAYAFNYGVKQPDIEGKGVYGWEQLEKGDIIETANGNKFKVLDKNARGTNSDMTATDNMGILVSFVGSLETALSDVTNKDDNDTYSNNFATTTTSILDSASSNQETLTLANNKRGLIGTNFWEEMELIHNVLSNFKNDEASDFSSKGLITPMPQQQALWWGDGDAGNYTTNATDEGRDASRFFSGSGGQDNELFVGRGHTTYTTGTVNEANYLDHIDVSSKYSLEGFHNSDELYTPETGITDNTLRYTINDDVFLPSLEQAESNGLDKTWTRSPYANDKNGGGKNWLWNGKDAGTKQPYATGAIVTGEDNGGEDHVIPMMYLSTNILFTNATTTNNQRVFSGISRIQSEYSASDLYIGDYVSLDGTDFRVIGKDNNGLMVRSDRPVDYRSFDSSRSIYNDDGDVEVDKERPAINSTMYGYDAYTGESREFNGSNFYLESDIRTWLLDDYYASLPNSVKNAVNQNVVQDITFWHGDAKREAKVTVNKTNVDLTYETDRNIAKKLGLSVNGPTFIDRYQAVKDGNLDYTTGWSLNARRNVVGYEDNDVFQTLGDQNQQFTDSSSANRDMTNLSYTGYEKLSTILFNDPVFLQSYIQVAEFSNQAVKTSGGSSNNNVANNKLVLTNAIGGNYAVQILSDKDNTQVNAYTRSPLLRHDTNATAAMGTGVIDYSNHNSEYSSAGWDGDAWIGTNIGLGAGMADHPTDINTKDHGILPTMYLKYDTLFELSTDDSVGVDENGFNPGENATTLFGGQNYDSSAKRRTPVAGDRDGLHRFVLSAGTGLDLSSQIGRNELQSRLKNLTVGTAIDAIELQADSVKNGETGIAGITVKDNMIVGTPTKFGEQTFELSDVENFTFKVAVAKGTPTEINFTDPMFGSDNAADITKSIGTQFGTELDQVSVTTKENVSGKLQFVDANENPTVGSQTYSVNFVPSDNNWNTVAAGVVTIIAGEELATDDFTPGAVSATFGDSWTKILDDNKTMGIGGLPSEAKVELSGVSMSATPGDVGTHTVSVTITVGGQFKTLEDFVTVTVTRSTTSAPDIEVEGVAQTLSATYGDKISSLQIQLDSINRKIQQETGRTDGTFSFVDSTKDVGDAGTQSIDLKYVVEGGNYEDATAKIDVTVAKADRDSAQITKLTDVVKGVLVEKAVANSSTDDAWLPSGFKFKTAGTVGSPGNENTFTILVDETVNAEGSTGAPNYNATEFDVTFTVSEPEGGARNDGGNMTLIIVLAVVGVAVVGGIVFFVLKKKQSGGSKF